MEEERTTRIVPDWRACVSTVKCDLIGEYVSIVVKNDWTCSCTWYKRLKDETDGRGNSKIDRRTRNKLTLCKGPVCSHVKTYCERLMEEAQGKSSERDA